MRRPAYRGSLPAMSEERGEASEPVEVPYAAISAEALHGLVESFVLREGTDYGAHEFTLAQKTAQVLAQIRRGEVRILFDPDSQSVTLAVIDGAPRG